MFQLICRQRGCALEPAEIMPLLCPVCKNPLLMEDQIDVETAADETGDALLETGFDNSAQT